MQKSEKAELIKEMSDKFARAKTVIVTEFHKMDVETVTKLRKKLRDGGVEYKVLKNTLAKRALKGTDYEVLIGHFEGATAVAYTTADPVALARPDRCLARARASAS